MTPITGLEPYAPIPEVGTWWLWEPDMEYVRELIQIVDVRWLGEPCGAWWVLSRAVADHWSWGELNQLADFWRSCEPVPDYELKWYPSLREEVLEADAAYQPPVAPGLITVEDVQAAWSVWEELPIAEVNRWARAGGWTAFVVDFLNRKVGLVREPP